MGWVLRYKDCFPDFWVEMSNLWILDSNSAKLAFEERRLDSLSRKRREGVPANENIRGNN